MKRIYKPRLGLNDISVLSKSCYVGSLSRDKAVIWRMSDKQVEAFDANVGDLLNVGTLREDNGRFFAPRF